VTDQASSGAPSADPSASGLARALADLGRRTRDVVRQAHGDSDQRVVRTEGGDDVFGVDVRAEDVLVAGFAELGRRWPGTAVIEGFDEPLVVGAPGGPWRYLVDPVDGTRPYLAGKRSAWVLLGAGREATTLDDLEVGAMVEIPTRWAGRGRVAWATSTDAAATVEVDDLLGSAPPEALAIRPKQDGDLARTFVTVVRLLPGSHGPIGAWADAHLAGLEVYDDLVPCSAQYLFGVASGADAAVFDPRPLFHPEGFSTHPYDLASIVVARAAGAIVEALPPGPLSVPLDTDTAVAWAAYANETIAERLRPTSASFPGG
jgi:fructose-1,6-bisphosphatase/inositol monophosphatase family enzyme